MRIISGKHRGKHFLPPKKLPVRPTTDKAKEAIFNILQHEYDFEGVQVLDLFSGTGNISYEFLSRGVTGVTAVDSYRACLKYIRETATLLGENIDTYHKDVFNFLQNTTTKNYHIIFADPPYNFNPEKTVKIIDIIFQKGWLNSEIGTLILEHSDKISLQDHPNFYRSKNYGKSIFSFFEG